MEDLYSLECKFPQFIPNEIDSLSVFVGHTKLIPIVGAGSQFPLSAIGNKKSGCKEIENDDAWADR